MKQEIEWISVDKQLPEPGKWVACCRMDNSYPVWVTKGRVLESGTWSLKATVGLTFRNSKPTHFIELPQI